MPGDQLLLMGSRERGGLLALGPLFKPGKGGEQMYESKVRTGSVLVPNDQSCAFLLLTPSVPQLNE